MNIISVEAGYIYSPHSTIRKETRDSEDGHLMRRSKMEFIIYERRRIIHVIEAINRITFIFET